MSLLIEGCVMSYLSDFVGTIIIQEWLAPFLMLAEDLNSGGYIVNLLDRSGQSKTLFRCDTYKRIREGFLLCEDEGKQFIFMFDMSSHEILRGSSKMLEVIL